MALTGAFGQGAAKAKSKLKKPKDLPKTPINKGNVSPMIAPNLYVTPRTPTNIVPRMPSNDNLAVDPRFAGVIGGTGPGGQPATGTPAMIAPPSSTPTATFENAGTVSGPGGGGSAGSLPGGYTDTAYLTGWLNEHPEVVAADVLAGMGITNMDMVGMLAELVKAGPAMYLLNQGTGAGDFATGPEAELGYLQNFTQGLMTPGGSGMGGMDDLMGAIMNADPASPLGAFLAHGSPTDVRNLIEAAAMMGTGNPYYQNAIQRQMDVQDLSFNQGMARGAPMGDDAYYQAVRSGPLGQYF